MKNLFLVIIVNTILWGATRAADGSLTCQDLNQNLKTANTGSMSLVCWDDDENGCDNDDDGCLLPKACTSYTVQYTYTTGGNKQGKTKLHKLTDATSLKTYQTDKCIVDEVAKTIVDAERLVANLAI